VKSAESILQGLHRDSLYALAANSVCGPLTHRSYPSMQERRRWVQRNREHYKLSWAALAAQGHARCGHRGSVDHRIALLATSTPGQDASICGTAGSTVKSAPTGWIQGSMPARLCVSPSERSRKYRGSLGRAPLQPGALGNKGARAPGVLRLQGPISTGLDLSRRGYSRRRYRWNPIRRGGPTSCRWRRRGS
jgi:hypothetical protein